jgi:methionine-S-sulfoxide reductase
MTKIAYFASGCFWGTEYYFSKTQGVVSTTVGYMGGEVPSPTYEQVSTGQTGHVETAKVEYDPAEITFEDLVKLFFETHDATQVGGQGPDIGSQYESKVFYNNDEEKTVINKLIKILENKGLRIVTKVEKASIFYSAENYHQDYYSKNGQAPYCHIYHKLF